MTDLSSSTVLAIVTNYGVEQDELVVPVQRLRDAGAAVTVAATTSDPVQTLVGDKDPGQQVTPDTTLGEVDPSTFDLLLIPGGTLNADALRLEQDALDAVRSFTGSGRPVAAICHGPWVVLEAGAAEGKRLTSYASLETDLRNAGVAEWVDEEVVTDDTGGWLLITSRTPKDLDAFVGAAEQALSS